MVPSKNNHPTSIEYYTLHIDYCAVKEKRSHHCMLFLDSQHLIKVAQFFIRRYFGRARDTAIYTVT